MIRDSQNWMSFEDIIADANVQLRTFADLDVGWPTLKLWASQACREFARRSETVRDDYKTVLIADQQEYQLPEDCLLVDSVSITYPGWTNEMVLRPLTQRQTIDMGVVSSSGVPYNWYVNHERKKVGLYPTPSDGGVEALTTSLAGDTVSIVSTALSSTDDAYNGRTVRILSGDQEGQERTISDYDGATTTITVDTAFAAAIASGVEFQINPDSLRILYTKAGNSYRITPTAATVGTVTDKNTFALDLPDRPQNWWKGCEVRFTSGTLNNEITRIVSATSTTTPVTTVTVAPALFTAPTANDTVVVTDVPNIPAAYHTALVEFILHLGHRRNGNSPMANDCMARFMEFVTDAKRGNRPTHGQAFHRVRETRIGEGRY